MSHPPRSKKGETLAETLIALLLVCIASVALASMVMAASRMNATAMERDDALYAAVSQAEIASLDDGSGTVEVTVDNQSQSFSVDYSGSDIARSYNTQGGEAS